MNDEISNYKKLIETLKKQNIINKDTLTEKELLLFILKLF